MAVMGRLRVDFPISLAKTACTIEIMIEEYHTLTRRRAILLGGLNSALDRKDLEKLHDGNGSFLCEERPNLAVQRYRIGIYLVAIGAIEDVKAVDSFPLSRLVDIANDYQSTVDIIAGRQLELECEIIDAQPHCIQSALAKSQFLLMLLKDVETYSTDLIAFALEDCVEIIARITFGREPPAESY